MSYVPPNTVLEDLIHRVWGALNSYYRTQLNRWEWQAICWLPNGTRFLLHQAKTNANTCVFPFVNEISGGWKKPKICPYKICSALVNSKGAVGRFTVDLADETSPMQSGPPISRQSNTGDITPTPALHSKALILQWFTDTQFHCQGHRQKHAWDSAVAREELLKWFLLGLSTWRGRNNAKSILWEIPSASIYKYIHVQLFTKACYTPQPHYFIRERGQGREMKGIIVQPSFIQAWLTSLTYLHYQVRQRPCWGLVWDSIKEAVFNTATSFTIALWDFGVSRTKSFKNTSNPPLASAVLLPEISQDRHSHMDTSSLC